MIVSAGIQRSLLRAAYEGRENVAAALGSVVSGHLLFTHGIAPDVTIRGAGEESELFGAYFERPIPDVAVEDGRVTIEYPRFPRRISLRRPLPADIALNRTIPWHIEIRGGMAHVRADLRDLPISEIELSGGAADIRLLLPRQFGATPLRFSGGISDLTIRRPEEVGVSLDITGGAADLRLDEQHFGAIGGEMRWESSGYRTATDRYDIRIIGGVSRLRIEAERPGMEI